MAQFVLSPNWQAARLGSGAELLTNGLTYGDHMTPEGLKIRGWARYPGTNFSLPSAGSINKVSEKQKEPRDATFIGTNTAIPVTFGRDRFYAKPFVITSEANFLYVAYMVGEGPIAGFRSVLIDNRDINNPTDGFLLAAGAQVNTYTGTDTQNPDPLLAAVISGFDDDYRGSAYLVIKAPINSSQGFPRVEVEIDGLMVPRVDTHSPFEFTEALVGDRNLITNAAHIGAAGWSVESSAVVTQTGEFIGEFEKTTVASAGSAAARANFVFASGVPAEFALTLYFQWGTSGKMSLLLRNNTDSLSLALDFTQASMPFAVGNTSTTSLGDHAIIDYREFSEYNVVRLLFTPAAPASSHTIGFGPNSTTVGETLIAYGAQMEAVDRVTAQATENPVNYSAFVMKEHLGWAVNEAAARDAANWNNDVLPNDNGPRRSMGMSYFTPEKTDNLLENVRAYSGCVHGWEDGQLVFITYSKKPVSGTIGPDEIVSLSLRKRKQNETATVVSVQFTDAEGDYRTREATEKVSGNVPRRLSRVQLTGCHSYNMARREAIMRVNERLADLTAAVTVMDEGLEYQLGDVLEISHPIGLASKPMQIIGFEHAETAGIWRVVFREYQPELFSDAVQANASFPDTNLPVHTTPPAVTGIVLEEEVYKRRNGEWDNRVSVTWDASPSPYVQWYIVRYKLGGVVIASVQEAGTQTAYGPLEEGASYTVEVIAVTGLYQSPPASVDITPLGKLLIPSDVPAFTGYEVGGLALFAWEEAIDLDIVGYELRYGTAGVTWENAQTINVVDSLRYQTREIPPGVWDFLIKARDSVDQSSVNALRISFEVTLDYSSLLVAEGEFVDSDLLDARVHRVREVREANEIIYTNSASETWDDLFGSGSLAAFTAPMAQYQANPATDFVYQTETFAIGYDVAGDWRASTDFKNYRGIVPLFGIADTGGSFTDYTNLSVKRAGGETYMRFEGVGIARIEVPQASFRIDAVTRTETGNATSSSAGAVTVTMANGYSAYKNITVTPVFSGSAVAVIPVVDAVVIGGVTSFDVLIFSAVSPGTLVSSGFIWGFEGV